MVSVHRVSGSILGAVGGGDAETAALRSKPEPPQMQFSDGRCMSNTEREDEVLSPKLSTLLCGNDFKGICLLSVFFFLLNTNL